jgi:hypothetical protein
MRKLLRAFVAHLRENAAIFAAQFAQFKDFFGAQTLGRSGICSDSHRRSLGDFIGLPKGSKPVA